MKIIIMGAGLAGLSLAVVCKRAGYEVKLYEKARQLHNIGGGILIWPHGQRYLAWLGLAPELNTYRTPVERCQLMSITGKKLASESYAPIYALLGGEVLPIDRSLFQQTLLSQLPAELLYLGKTCIAIKNEAHQATLRFSDGTEDSADLVVGADGIHSFVRSIINEKAVLHYTNNCWWGGIIEQKAVPSLSPHEVFFALGIGKTCIVWPTAGERFMWYLPVKMPVARFNDETDHLSLLKSLCSGWSREVEQIITAPACAQSFKLPIYTLEPQASWSSSRVTLIGDAAHALGPILGLGAGQAIEDVFLLFNALQNNPNNLPLALHTYENSARTKAHALFEMENQSAALMINDNHLEIEAFQQQIQELDLVTLYKDLIPLIDEKSCLNLAAAVNFTPSL